MEPSPPRRITGPAAWHGRDLKESDAWLFRLSAADIAEIDAAVAASRSLRIQDIGRAQFPLPTLGRRLDALLDELWAIATAEALCWRHQWRVGDVVMWDNRCVMHRRDAFDASARRVMHRTQIKGG